MVCRRQRRSPITSSQSTEQLFLKLERLTSRHEQMKIAYHELKSQISAGLLEAEDVFASLAIPLMKLVGLKTREMAEEGRFTTIIIDNNFSQGSGRNGLESLDVTTRRKPENQVDVMEEESYANRVSMVGKELVEKQQTNFLQLVHLLKQVETQVKGHQDDIFESLENHRASLYKFLQKAIQYLSVVRDQNGDVSQITLKLLVAMFKNVNVILGSVEGGVKNLMQALADKMCDPMVDYMKGLKDDMKNGTCARLVAIVSTVEEMERMMSNGRVELEEARKRARVAEEEKLKAIYKLKTIEGVMRMRRQFSLPEAEVTERTTTHKFLEMVREQAKDEKLLWDLLKRKRKCQAAASPMGAEGLLTVSCNNRHRKLEGAKLSMDQTSFTSRTRRRFGPQTPRLNSIIPLGSSPSAAAIQPAV